VAEGSESSLAATLLDVYGQVEVASSLGGWHTVGDGDKVESGQQMRVGSQSNATLVFFDGSRTTVGPDSELTLKHLGGSRSSVCRLRSTKKLVKPTTVWFHSARVPVNLSSIHPPAQPLCAAQPSA